jgi:hypothetical protein
MRGMQLLAFALIAGNLAGCCSVSPRMNSQSVRGMSFYSEPAVSLAAPPVKSAVPKHHAQTNPLQIDLARRNLGQSSTSGSATTGHASDMEALLPFSPAWYAHEDEIDERLKRIMNICNGC